MGMSLFGRLLPLRSAGVLVVSKSGANFQTEVMLQFFFFFPRETPFPSQVITAQDELLFLASREPAARVHSIPPQMP